jgi:xanthine/CO dehydrogenase XdhC/CoxF family maturation factor
VSIAAEMIALRWGGKGARLASTTGRVHREPGSPVQQSTN